jgi:hypothetical protein
MTDVPSPAGAFRGPLRKALVGSFLIAAGYGAYRALRGHGAELAGLLGRRDAGWYLAAALVANLAWILLGAQAWRRVLGTLGSALSPAAGARICFAAIVGAYLPGPGQALAAVHAGQRTGVPSRRVLAGYLLIAMVNVLSAASLGLLAAPFVVGADWGWLLLPALLCGAVLWRPGIVLGLAHAMARLLRRGPLTERAEPDGLRHALLWQTGAWAAAGVQLWLIAVALGAPRAGSLFLCVGGYALAAAAGAVAFVLPDGAGVREVVIVAALSFVMPVSDAAAAAIGCRICLMAAQLLFGGGLLMSSRLHRT